MDEEHENVVTKKKSEPAPPRRRLKKIVIPRRELSVIVPGRQIVFTTPDKTTCAECTCFPKEDPYVKPKKLNHCQKSPKTLYELAAVVVDSLTFPAAFKWSEDEVAEWMASEVGMPQYKECIIDNYINGARLLMLEDPSHLAQISIRNFNDIKKITSHVRRLFSTEFVKFCRSIGLPPRKPLTHCTWFKSRTGPSWGIRQSWTRCDILRWMKILGPPPLYIDHWDAVWYQKPEFPKVKFARVSKALIREQIPRYRHVEMDVCREYQVPRKFKIQSCIPDEEQLIWMEHRSFSLSPCRKEKPKKKKQKKKLTVPKKTSLMPKVVDMTKLKGEALILARRKMPKAKFFS